MGTEQSASPNAAQSPMETPKKTSLFWPICAAIGGLMVIGQFMDDDKQTTRSTSVPVLDQAAAVFRGNHTRAQIKVLLDEVMEMNGVPRTEHEYDRWTNVLVALRQDSGATEMEILRCIRGMKATVPFPDSAGICAAGKQTGLY